MTDNLIKKCFLYEKINGDKTIRLGPRERSAAIIAAKVIVNSDQAVTTRKLLSILKNKGKSEGEIRGMLNRFTDINFGVYPFSHGSWGVIKHIGLPNDELKRVAKICLDFILASSSEQFHTRELFSLVPKEYKFSKLNEFTISAILREYSNLTYLGRNVFVKPGSSSSKRQLINNVIVTILEEYQRPMHIKEIMPILNKIRSVDINMPIHEKGPLKKMRANYWALSYWNQEKQIVNKNKHDSFSEVLMDALIKKGKRVIALEDK